MNYKYVKTRENGDATCNYDIVGEFPVKFIDFFKWVLAHENSFRVEFGASNECYGGWLGNRIGVHKSVGDEHWYWEKKEPDWWWEEIAHENITGCWANGGWGQTLYICTFEE